MIHKYLAYLKTIETGSITRPPRSWATRSLP